MAAVCPKMLPLAAAFIGLHICHRVSSLPKPHRVEYVTISTLLLASFPATYSTAGYCRPYAPRTIWHHCHFFSCISPAMVFYYSATSFGRRSRVARSCPVAASCLMVLPSSTCLLSRLNTLKVLQILSVAESLVQSARNCRHTICSSLLQTKYVWTRHRSAGRRERGEPSTLFSLALNACSNFVLVEFL